MEYSPIITNLIVAVLTFLLTYFFKEREKVKAYVHLSLTVSKEIVGRKKYLKALCRMDNKSGKKKSFAYTFLWMSEYDRNGKDSFDESVACIAEKYGVRISETNSLYLIAKEMSNRSELQANDNRSGRIILLPQFFRENIDIDDEELQAAYIGEVNPGVYSVRFFVYPSHTDSKKRYHRFVHDAITV